MIKTVVTSWRNCLKATVGLLMALSAGQSFGAHEGYPFEVITEKSGAFHQVLARNNGPASITAKIIFDSTSAASDRAWPAVLTIAPGQAVAVGKVYASTPGQQYSFKTSYFWRLGEVNAASASDVSYRLPFADGLSFPVAQAPGGPQFTHDTLDSLYAVDFSMPEGTPVVAARAGTVIEVKSHFREGRLDPALAAKANGVLIAHDDGTLARYAHFMPAPALVRLGQRVEVGTLLGYSGNTGYSGGPHLHFAVTRVIVRPDGNLDEESLPITFYAFDPPVSFRPQAGAVLAADYSRPGRNFAQKDGLIPLRDTGLVLPASQRRQVILPAVLAHQPSN